MFADDEPCGALPTAAASWTSVECPGAKPASAISIVNLKGKVVLCGVRILGYKVAMEAADESGRPQSITIDGSNLAYMVNSAGAISTSSDGVSWTKQESE